MGPKLEKGLVQVYTGDGKGKTTAALGQAFRSIGRGLKVCMIQFLKGSSTGELNSVKKVEPDFQIFRFEKNRGFFWTLSDEEKRELKQEVETGFEFAKRLLAEGKCDILILDEIMAVLHNKLLAVEKVCDLIRNKPEHVELILTGRNAPQEIVELADLVTEMREIKHYYDKGIPARKGIEL
ncbi:MAG TPA: cob(I)yrinic acid a,c-diamide adenosyltransferase [Syntrophomonadaceae bacterium]|nr:cob(I)yrinic acid a,c-diamide adenosyltransferase [Syntrophomonadaceae bacterium]